MPIEEELARVPPQGEMVLTIGVFDGVHLGHSHLIRRVIERASQGGFRSGVVTFYPHPVAVLRPQTVVSYLNDLDERVELIKQVGVDAVIPVTFSQAVSQLTAREFVQLVVRHLRMKGLVIGPDFALGRGREGNAAMLKSLGDEMGFALEVVSPLTQGQEIVSSTAIRDAIARGDMSRAARLLGRPFSVSGAVVHGVGRGHALGFPTANLGLDPQRALPPDGVYVARAYVDERPHQSVTNIGVRPTFDGGERTVEVFLLDFEGDLYGRHLKIELLERLRGEMRFSGVEELKAQIAKDVVQARRVLEQNTR